MPNTLISREQTAPAGALDDLDNDGQPAYPAILPPFGSIGEDASTHGQALAFLSRIAEQAARAREDHIRQAETNALVFKQGQEATPSPQDCIANDIQTTVLSVTEIQTREPFSIFIRPVQTRDKAQVFWIGPPVDERVAMLVPGLPLYLGMEPVIDPMTGQPAMQAMVDPMSGMPAVDQMGQPMLQPIMQPATTFTPMDEITAWQVKKLAATGTFPAEWFVSVDDRLVADVYQTVLDVKWKEDGIDHFIRENIFKTNNYGYQGSYYAWDPERKRHVVRDVSIKQLLLDPKAEGANFDLQNCPGYEVVMYADEAKAAYPHLAKLIDEHARPGNAPQVDSTSEFGVASDIHFEAPVVTFRVHWFRNQQVPMLEHEAEKAGKVIGEDDPVSGEKVYYLADGGTSDQSAAGAPGLLGAGAPASPDDAIGGDGGTLSQLGGSGGFETSIADGPGNAGVDPNAGIPQWPLTLAIREIATIAETGRIVRDIRCEHFDIPLLLNICIPLPSTPFGQGLPEKLKGMQQADIRLLNAIVKYAETFATPGSMVPKSVADACAKGLKRMHLNPNETVVAPDHLIERFGEKAVLWFQPPPMPPAVPAAMAMLDERQKRTSGNTDVMSGTAPSPNSSGRLVEALQNAAMGQFGLLGQWTVAMVERLANLMHYSHTWRLEVADLLDIYPRLPEPIMQLVVDRARRGRWDNYVEHGGGMQAIKRLQRAMALFEARSGTGEPAMPLKMLREAANIDSEEASLAFREEMMNATPPAPVGQPGQPGDQLEPASDGQGTAQ